MARHLKNDLTGKKFTRLTAIKHVGSGKWLCRCDCGVEKIVLGGNLLTGNTKSCGCLNNSPIEDLSGRRFGRLVAERYVGGSKWLCKCDCGNEKEVLSGSLTSGNTKSCGCLYSEVAGKATFDDKTGRRYGRLTVTEYLGNSRWLCRCDCGNTVDVNGHELARGSVRSCGCFQRELASVRHTTHGGKKERLYIVWSCMKQRCFNKNNHAYKYYGANGVTVCEEWLDYANFREWAMSHGYDPEAPFGECTIDRIDPSGNYCPENCRWVPNAVQAQNKRDNHKRIVMLDDDDNPIGRFNSAMDAAAFAGCTASAIRHVCRGAFKAVKGLRFAYAEDLECAS